MVKHSRSSNLVVDRGCNQDVAYFDHPHRPEIEAKITVDCIIMQLTEQPSIIIDTGRITLTTCRRYVPVSE